MSRDPGADASTVRRTAAVPTAVLVEGVSDQRAVEALAGRLGRDLAAEGIAVLAMGGAKGIRAFLDRYGPAGENLALAGLCDAPEEADFRRGLEWAGLGAGRTRVDLERLGFFVCDQDLEDELIRALGTEAVLAILEAQGELGPFRTFQRQPEKRGQPLERQLHRFMGVGSGRKIRMAPLMIEALDLDRVPRPLAALLAHL